MPGKIQQARGTGAMCLQAVAWAKYPQVEQCRKGVAWAKCLQALEQCQMGAAWAKYPKVLEQ